MLHAQWECAHRNAELQNWIRLGPVIGSTSLNLGLNVVVRTGVPFPYLDNISVHKDTVELTHHLSEDLQCAERKRQSFA